MREPKAQDAERVNWRALATDSLPAVRAVHEAIVAVSAGEADADQQRVFMTALRDMFCRAELSTFADSERVSNMLAGRRAVWLELNRAAKAKLADLIGETNDR